MNKIKIEWTRAGWYKTIDTDTGIKLVWIAALVDTTRPQAQTIAGAGVTVNFYFDVPEYMEVVK